MLTSIVAAFAAQALGASPFPNGPNTTTSYDSSITAGSFTIMHEDRSPIIVKRLLWGTCPELCQYFKDVTYDCLLGGWRTDCVDACIIGCWRYKDVDYNPPWSDFVTSVSEDRWGRDGPANPDRFTTDVSYSEDEVKYPCRFCKRDTDGTVIGPSTDVVDLRLKDLVVRVEGYGAAYHHVRGFQHEASRKQVAGAATQLDDYLRAWVVGFKKAAAGSENRQMWYNELVERVVGSVQVQPQYWAYRLELIARKDTDRDLNELVAGLEEKDRKRVKKAVHRAWNRVFADGGGAA